MGNCVRSNLAGLALVAGLLLTPSHAASLVPQAPEQPTQPLKTQEEATSAEWGPLPLLIGPTWGSPSDGGIWRYRWVVPNKTLEVFYPDSPYPPATHTLLTNGMIEIDNKTSEKEFLRFNADGSYSKAFVSNAVEKDFRARVIYTLGVNGYTITTTLTENIGGPPDNVTRVSIVKNGEEGQYAEKLVIAKKAGEARLERLKADLDERYIRSQADHAEIDAEDRRIQADHDARNRSGTANRLGEIAAGETARSVYRASESARQMGEDAIAEGLARGTAEYNRKQAAAGRPVEVTAVAPTRSAASLSSGRVDAPSLPSSAPQQTGYLWCYAYDQESSNPVKGTVYSSNVGTFSHSHRFANNEATKQPFVALMRNRLRGTGEPGACYVETSVAEIDEFKANLRRLSFPNAKWEDVSFTPKFIPVGN